MEESNQMEESGTSSQADDIKEIQNELMNVKGDEIGSTLYSERWVLKTMIELSKFSEENWNESFEEQLCLFWDVTVEEDIVLYLISHDIFSLIFKVLKENTQNKRLMEILVGILGNLCHVEPVRRELSSNDHHCLFLINLLDYEDSLTLVQLLRLLNTCLWDSRTESNEERNHANIRSTELNKAENRITNKWTEYFVENLEFVLQHLEFFLTSSVNELLLTSTLELLETLIDIPELGIPEKISSSPDFISGVIESLKQLLKTLKTSDSLASNKSLSRAFHSWENISKIITTYPEGLENLAQQFENIGKCLSLLLCFFSATETTQEMELLYHVLCIMNLFPDAEVESSLLVKLINTHFNTAMSDLKSEKWKEELKETEDEELIEIMNSIQSLIKHGIRNSEDILKIVQCLKSSTLEYLRTLFSSDKELLRKLQGTV